MTRRRLLGAAGLLLVAALAAVATVQLTRPVPPPRLALSLTSTYTAPGSLATLAWPGFGQAAVALQGVGVVAERGPQAPVPIASVTKLMTALVVLRAHPLAAGEPGPLVPVTAPDQALYLQEQSAGDSVVAVVAGESLTELQLLEGLLLPSGDNLAQLLAVWSAGSLPGFVAEMNLEARRLGMSATSFADSSGVDPGSRSTPADLLRLAAAVMAEPVLAEVVRMPSATLPVAGVVHNLDFVLGQQGIVGMKTGWTSAAGGCFVAASVRSVGGRRAMLLSAVVGAPGGPTGSVLAAEAATVTLLGSVWPEIRLFDPLPDSSFARVVSRWLPPVPVRPRLRPHVLGWPGVSLRLRSREPRLPDAIARGRVVATVQLLYPVGEGPTVALVTTGRLPGPTVGWRLTRW